MRKGRPTFFVRAHARLHDERGFGLLETIIAVTVMFGALLTLAYTATVGFGYQDISRQRQTANALADRVMEETRALAYDRIKSGLLSTDLGGDPNILACGSPAVYRFLSCTAGSTPGSGEKIVSSPGISNVVPLVPHRGTTEQIDGIAYDWATYVTQDDAATGSPHPYRVTVLVTWSAGKAQPNKLVRVQSLFWSPSGCVGTDTHPFAAPCQPFFFADATVPNGALSITGSIQGITFSSGDLLGAGANSSGQLEQIPLVSGGFRAPQVQLTDGSGTRTAGGVSGSSSADGDPGSSTGTYSRVRCPTEIACDGGSVTSPNGGGSTQIAITAPSGATAETDSAVSAGGTDVCPPPTDTAETDGQFCAGSRTQQSGSITAIPTLNGTTPALGAFTLAQMLASGSVNKAIVDRVVYPSTGACSPTSTSEGCVQAQATRNVGTINIGALPSGFTAPSNWSTGSPGSCRNYFLSITSFSDTATARVGTDIGSQLAPAAPTGTVCVYDQEAGQRATYNVNSSSLNGLSKTLTLTQTISGTQVTVTIETVPAGMSASSDGAITSTSPSSGVYTSVSANSIPPAIQVRYRITTPSATLMDLTTTVVLGSLEARGTYSPAPAQGA